MVRPIALIIVSLGLASCDRGGAPATEPAQPGIQVQTLGTSSVQLYDARECERQSSTRPTPSSGDVFDYRLVESDGSLSSSVRRQTITTSSGDQTGYTEVFLLQGAPPTPAESRQVRFAVLPTSAPGRSVRYDAAEAAIQALSAGESTTIPMAETAGGETAEGEASLTFVGCGVTREIVRGAPNQPVRVFRLLLPFSSSERPGDLSRAVEFESIVSEELGWVVAERSGTSVSVLAPTP